MANLNKKQELSLKKKNSPKIMDQLKDQDLMVVSRTFIFNIIYDFNLDSDQVLQKLKGLFQHPTEQRRSKRTIQ